MLSNKLTFSLASLIVLIAIGLIGVTPAIGQDVTFTLDATNHLGVDNFIIVTNGAPGTVRTANGITDPPTGATYSEINGSGLPDLQDFFVSGGGTIELIGPVDVTDTANIMVSKAKDVVISEIMWGKQGTDDTTQWIELYVVAGGKSKGTATGAVAGDTQSTVALPGSWILRLTPNVLTDSKIDDAVDADDSDTVTANDGVIVDKVSNWGLGYWAIQEDGAYGQSGMEANPNANPPTPATRRISMYRDIAYKDVVNPAKTDMEQRDATKDGTRSGNWKESAAPRGANQSELVFASPGEAHFQGLVQVGDTTVVARDGVIFNEIANRGAGSEGDWIELYNSGTASVNVVDYTLRMITGAALNPTDEKADGSADNHAARDAKVFTITHPDGDPITIDPGEYLLIVSKDPAETGLTVGTNVTNDDVEARAASSYYLATLDDGTAWSLPDTAGFTLTLKSGTDEAGTPAKIADIAVGNNGYFALQDDDPVYNTDVWPLKSTQAGAKDDLGTVATDGTAIIKTWVRDHTKDLFHGDAWKSDGGFTGVGVGRNSTITGTPGFDNDSVKGEFADADGMAVYTGSINISEIMVAQTRRNLAQWIELFNSSTTQAINVKGWEVSIQNVESDDLDAREEVKFKIKGDLIVPPRQAVLIVSTTTNNTSDNIPRVYSLYTNHRDKLEVNRRSDSVLSVEGFYITLSDARDVEADAVGNTDSDGTVLWELPMAEEGRSSLTRVYTGGQVEDGTLEESWLLTSATNNLSEEYYGHRDDMASPGDRQGMVLPVSLSSFRPMRDKATGAVAIRWITQSELNNAGFNILRSETKKGEFKVVNLKGIIAGHGTTSEKHVYEWTDTSAKPNVVYFYQIEDVSLDGKRTTLRTTHLRGNVNAAGKATTTWADLKTLHK